MSYRVGDPAGVLRNTDGLALVPAVVVAVTGDAREGQRVTFRASDGWEVTWSGGNLRDYASKVETSERGPWAVLSVDVKHVLGRYADRFGAVAAAAAFGGCAFAYELSADEVARIDAVEVSR